MFLRPIKLVIFGMSIFVFMMLIAPFDLLTDISLEAIIFIILYLICFITDCLLKLSHPGVNRGRKLWNSIYNLSTIRTIGLSRKTVLGVISDHFHSNYAYQAENISDLAKAFESIIRYKIFGSKDIE